MMITKKLYDMDAYATEFEAKVLSCVEKEMTNADGEKEIRYAVILNQTLFFPEEGGQTPDKGMLGGAKVLDVQLQQDAVLHFLAVPLEVGMQVKGKIDWQHRFFNMQQHSGEHLFSGLADRKYGYKNVGFHLSNQIVTMDFDGVFTEEQLQELEWEVNEAITANVEIKTGYPSEAELEMLEYRSKLELKENVRIVEILGYDICACCAPHVHRTGEIGIFKIQNVQNYKGGVRIRFLCGFRALEEYRQKSQIISELSQILTTNQNNLPEHVQKMKQQVQSLKTQLAQAKQQLMEYKIADIPAEQKDVLLFEEDLETLVIRNLVNTLMETHTGICAVFVGNDESGYQFILGSKTADCCAIAEKLRRTLNARGGGKTGMIQGSVNAGKAQIKEQIL